MYRPESKLTQRTVYELNSKLSILLYLCPILSIAIVINKDTHKPSVQVDNNSSNIVAEEEVVAEEHSIQEERQHC